MISTVLAERLAVRPGDTVTVEVLEGRRPVLEIPVVATFETYIGRPAYIDIDALNRAMHEPPSVTAVHLRVDPLFETRLYRELKQMPQVSAVNLRSAAVTTFNKTLAKTMLIYVGFSSSFRRRSRAAWHTTQPVSRSPNVRANWRRCACSASRGAKSNTSSSVRSAC